MQIPKHQSGHQVVDTYYLEVGQIIPVVVNKNSTPKVFCPARTMPSGLSLYPGHDISTRIVTSLSEIGLQVNEFLNWYLNCQS